MLSDLVRVHSVVSSLLPPNIAIKEVGRYFISAIHILHLGSM